MKKYIVLIVSLLLSIHLNAQQQYKHCLDDGIVRWSILAYEGADSGIQSTEISAYGDTLINGLLYKKLFVDAFDYLEAEESNTNWKNYTPDLFHPLKDFYIRESEDASQLYILNDNEEYLISDLNLQKGDEFLMNGLWWNGKIALVDSAYIENDLKHVQLVINPYDPEILTFIEGAGPNKWFIYPWYLWNRVGFLNCFQNQSIFYKEEAPDGYSFCPCGYRDMNYAINEIVDKEYALIIKRDKIEILFSDKADRQISLYNVNGILLDKKDFSAQQNITIPISSFPKGVYIVKIFNKEKNKISVSKIIL
jgi:hypothetical protein